MLIDVGSGRSHVGAGSRPWAYPVIVMTVLALCGGCRGSEPSEAPSTTPPSGTRLQKPQIALDAALPRLAPEREAFWARYIGDPGVPGPETLAFCRDAKADQITDIAPRTTLEKPFGKWCQLFIHKSPELIGEARVVLRRWSQLDTGTFIDTRNQLSTSLSIGAERLSVTWRAYVPLEAILGKDGQLLVGFDVKRVLGKSPLALRGAVVSPFQIAAPCGATRCAAEGPSPPGGGPVTIGIQEGTLPDIQVDLSTTRDLVPRVHTLLDASLGRGQQDGPSTHHVHRRDGIRYSVRDSDNGVVTITISPDSPD
ncbi:MAG: hypothetical protein M3619_07115 [Myxococcota bacterium]|nr:hypothetical protein [Myxococcota bacterium]